MTFVHRIWRPAVALGLLFVAAGVAVPVLASPLDVSIVDKTFQPATTTVNVGDTVTWTVTQAIADPHSVTAGKPGDTGTPLFDSGIKLQKNGDSYKFTFDKAGTYDYYCQVHPTVMTGVIQVLAPGQTPGGETPGVTSGATGGEGGEPVPPERRLLGAAILAVTLAVLFGAAALWRRMNPA